MKKLFLLLSAVSLYSATAFAEPLENKPMTDIDSGSVLTAVSDINIPNDGLLVQNGKFLTYYSQLDSTHSFCLLGTYDSKGKALERDSTIAPGTQLTLYSSQDQADTDEGTTGGVITVFQTAIGNYVSLQCWEHQLNSPGIGNVLDGTPSIAEFRGIFRGIANLKLAPPMPL